MMRNAEAAAQRLREQPRTRGGANQRERFQRQRDNARVHAAVHREVHAVFLHRGINIFLHARGQAMDFIYEQHVARLHARERAHQIARLGQRGTAGDIGARTHLRGNHMRQRCLAKSGRTVQQHMINRLIARARGVQRNANALHQRGLSYVFIKRARTQCVRLRIKLIL